MSHITKSAFALFIAVLVWTISPLSDVVHAGATLQVIAVVGGKPDDITTDAEGRLLWGDLASGTVNRLEGRRVRTVVTGLSVPEGLVALRNRTLAVAEQGLDRIVVISRRGKTTVMRTLVPVPGQEGVDGLGYDAHTNSLLVPDSPRGTVLKLNLLTRHVHTIARGLGRPVDAAVDAHGNILVPDEHLGTLVVISPRGAVSHLGTFSIPDDVVADRSGRIWITTLGDGGLWVIAPRAAPRRMLSALANPQGLTLDRCGDPIVVEQNRARIVRLVLTASGAHCTF